MSIQTAMKQFDDALADALGSKEEAEKGVVHWTAQVAKLTEAKTALSKILTPDDFAPAPAKSAKVAAKKGNRKASDFPSTDAAFWNGLLNSTPQTTNEILTAAAAKLSIEGEEKLAILRGRQTAFLQKAAKDGLIKSEGERLNRKYFV